MPRPFGSHPSCLQVTPQSGLGAEDELFSPDSAPDPICVAVTSASPRPLWVLTRGWTRPRAYVTSPVPSPGSVGGRAAPTPSPLTGSPLPGGGRGPTLCKAMARAPSAG